MTQQSIAIDTPEHQIPETPGLPLVGSIPTILNQQLNFLDLAQQQFGNIYRINLGVTSIVMLGHPAYAQYVLRDNARNFRKGGAMWDSVRTMLGNGLVVSEGDLWMRQRRMMNPHFHHQQLRTMTALMLDAIETAMRDWAGWAESGEAVDMLHAFNRITMKVIVQSMFGNDLSNEDSEMMGTEMAYALDFMLQNMVFQAVPTWIPVPGRARYQQALARVDAFLYRIIKQRRQMTDQPQDLLGMLLQLVDDESGAAMTDQQIRDEVATLFLAGYETTALTLSWGVHHLSNHPEVVMRLQSEIDHVLGQHLPTFETLQHLPYTHAVLQEIMRVHPPAFWIPRTAIEDAVIDGYPISAGQMVGVSVYNIHHNPTIWPEPEKFDPDRFSPDNAHNRHALAWMPFGAGQRMCIGRDFSFMEGTFILTRILQQYTFKAAGAAPVAALSTTLRPKNGVLMRLEKRG
jgi:cytochrome P450